MLKINGLLSINFSKRPPYTTTSLRWIGFSLIFSVFIIVAFIDSIHYFVFSSMSKFTKPAKLIQFMVYLAMTIMCVAKSIFGYLIQRWNQPKLMSLINEAQDLSHQIIDLCGNTITTCMSDTSSALFKAKVIATILQLITILSSLYVIYVNDLSYKLVVLIYSHWVGTMFSCMYFCGIFVIWQFYLTLNEKLRSSMDEVRLLVLRSQTHRMPMQKFCDLSDIIDRLARLYTSSMMFTEHVNDFFTVSIFVSLSYAFAVVLSQLFYIYGMLAKIAMNQPANAIDALKDGSFALYYMLDIYFVVAVSHAVIQEAGQSGKILYIWAVNIDDRLKQSVSTYILSFVLNLMHFFFISSESSRKHALTYCDTIGK